MRDLPGDPIPLSALGFTLGLGLFYPTNDVVMASPLLLGAGLATYSTTKERLNGALPLVAATVVVAVTTTALDLPIYITTVSVAVVVAGELVWRYLPRLLDDLSRSYVSLSVAAAAGAATSTLILSTRLDVLLLAGVSAALVAESLRVLSGGRRAWLALFGAAAAVLAAGSLPISVTSLEVGLALAVTGSLGLLAYVLEAMNVRGVLAGVLLGFTTIVVGGYRWFVLLGVFVVLGAASTKYMYDRKQDLGIAEQNRGRRGFANVMANGSVALIAVLAYPFLGDASLVAVVAFTATIATATADTLSSELCSVHAEPRLITTMERVPPGTDGGVSWQGEAVTLVSAALIGGAAAALGMVGVGGAVVVTLGGVVGAHTDSVLGATLEGRLLTNDTVNLGACTSGAASAVAAYLLVYV